MLNETDKIILERLLTAKEPVSGKELAALCGAAVNTVRKEIDLINEDISAHGLLIRSRLAMGYYVEVTDQELAGTYTDNLLYHLRRTRQVGLIHSPRAYYLTRRFLSSDRGLSAEGLCQELYCSRSALSKDLKQVREILAVCGLALENRRGGDGLRVTGTEWNIRQCLIYQHKICQILERQSWPQEGEFKAQFFMQYGADYDRTVRRQLTICLKKHRSFSLPMMHFPTIIHNVQLSLSRAKHRSELTFTREQTARAKDTPEYRMALELHSRLLPYEDGVPQEPDVLSTAMLLLSYESQNHWLERTPGCEAYRRTVAELIEAMAPFCPARMFDEVFVKDFVCYLFTLENRRVFHVFPDPEHTGSVRHSGLRSADLCLLFARFYQEKYHIRLSREDTLEAFYCFNRLVKRGSGLSALAKNMLVISQSGINAARAMAVSVKVAYPTRFDLVTPCDYPEHLEDAENYHLILTDRPSIHLREYGLPTVACEFGPGQGAVPALDRYLRDIRRQECSKLLSSDHLHSTHLGGKEEVFAAAAHCMKGFGVSEEAIRRHLRENDSLIDLRRGNGLVFLPILLPKLNGERFHLLVNDAPIDWNGEPAQVFACYTRTSLPADNETLWNILTRLIDLGPEEMAKLVQGGPAGAELLQV